MPRQARHVLMSFFGPNGLQSFVPKMHKTTIAHFAQFWEGKDEIMAGNPIKHLTFSLATDLFMSIKEGLEFYSLQHHMEAYVRGLNELPLNFPGTVYRKAILSRENMLGTLDKIICCRRKVKDLFLFLLNLLIKFLIHFCKGVCFQTNIKPFINSFFI
jgi:cytochrome P450 family 26 subfamily A